MSTRPADLSARLGIRVAFSDHDGDRPYAQIYDKLTGEGILNARGRDFRESYANATFAVRGPDRRSTPRPVRDRRQVSARPTHPLRRATDRVTS